MLATRSSDRVSDVLDFILRLYYQRRIAARYAKTPSLGLVSKQRYSRACSLLRMLFQSSGLRGHQAHPAEETVGTGPRSYALYLNETSDTAISAGPCVNFVRCQAMETTSFVS
jgi:hypothetical protein